MTIFTQEFVQDAYKAELSKPNTCRQSAIRATAQALCLSVETVKEVVEAKEGQPA